MFKLNLKTGNKKIIYKNHSLALKFLVDYGNLKKSIANIERVFNCKLSSLQKSNFLSKEGDTVRFSKSSLKPDEILLKKIKIDEKFNQDFFRNYLTELISSLKKEELKSLHLFIPSYNVFKKYFETEEYFYQSFIEGLYFGNYEFNKYKSEKKKPKQLDILLYADNEKKLKSAVLTAKNIMDAVYFTRDLQNEPASNLTPQLFAKSISAELKKYKIKVTVYGYSEIISREMGGLIAVGKGSQNKPRFIRLEYKPTLRNKKGKNKIKTVALVGKGVTFDTGGISLKPSKNMGEMKADMSGAAVVAGALMAASKNKLPIHLYGLIPAAENMPSGEAFRPGDVVTTASGKTIEVEDTDAEGRIILADALEYASKLKPDQIIDLATLTGACIVALGDFVAGMFTKNDQMAEQLYKSGIKTFDRVWRLPLWDDYNYLIESNIADVNNLGGRWGGAITAAKFLEKFVDKKISWAHLDIAGPAVHNDSRNYTKKYMTGFGVRLLFDYLSNKK